jgi:hypothetical protein
MDLLSCLIGASNGLPVHVFVLALALVLVLVRVRVRVRVLTAEASRTSTNTRTRTATTTFTLSFVLLALACVPDLDSDESTISEPRVLAVSAQPAEARPGESVSYTALLVDQNGVRSEGTLAWYYCEAQKPLAELGPINRVCLSSDGGKLSSIGRGFEVSGKLPTQACALFGPNLPPAEEGQEPGRPVDPDQTGGFNQPVMLGFNTGSGDSIVLYEQRILCDLAGVRPQLAAEFRQRYHPNQNPAINGLRITRANGESVLLGPAVELEVDAGEALGLEARWDTCPQSDRCGDGVCGPDESRMSCSEDCAQALGCSGAERYLWFNGQNRALEVRRESVRIAWYATAGSYADERTGVDETEQSARSQNRWTAPDGGDATLWLVMRDARGGVGTFQVAVKAR